MEEERTIEEMAEIASKLNEGIGVNRRDTKNMKKTIVHLIDTINEDDSNVASGTNGLEVRRVQDEDDKEYLSVNMPIGVIKNE